jgi:deazaflavin-dependent oxidoreductase (nitroreductase family)
MPAPPWLGRFNRVATNRVTRPAAGRLPGFGVVIHEGRKSGRRYRTPVNVFRRPGGVVIALTYGTGAEWVRNVVAAGRAEIVTRGRSRRVVNPRIVSDAGRSLVPAPVRPILGALRVDAFLVADLEPDTPLARQ